MTEVLAETAETLSESGMTYVKVERDGSGAGRVIGRDRDAQPMSVYFTWTGDYRVIESQMTLGKESRKGTHQCLSDSPWQVASNATFYHFQGLLP